jgi:hypothetical protein
MPFFWNPVGPAGTPLHILKDNRRETWAVDPRIQIIPTAYLPGQTHTLHAQNGALIVDTRSAMRLDAWFSPWSSVQAHC